MAEYKGKLLSGLFTKAKNVLLSDGVTSVEDAIPQRVYHESYSISNLATLSQYNKSITLSKTYTDPLIIINTTQNWLVSEYSLSGTSLSIASRNIKGDGPVNGTITVDVLAIGG